MFLQDNKFLFLSHILGGKRQGLVENILFKGRWLDGNVGIERSDIK